MSRNIFFLLVLSGILLSTSNVWADARVEARRHFRNGMDLIKKGNVDEGAEELLTAYDLLPHPNVLYNVARAYSNAGNYVQALLYYEQYLEAKPTDEKRIRPIVNGIRERLRKQTFAAFVQEGQPAGSTPADGSTAASPGSAGQHPITVTDEVLQELTNLIR